MSRTGVRLELPHMVKIQTDSCLIDQNLLKGKGEGLIFIVSNLY